MSESGKRKQTEPNAEVFTPAPVVAYMLDAVETARGRPFSCHDRILEPSAGAGAFVLPVLDRILATLPEDGWDDPALARVLLAFETNPGHVATLRRAVVARLVGAGCPVARAPELVAAWIRGEDFLLAEIERPFDAVVGNPPYVRFDAIAKADAAEYQRRYPTFRGRCDLCVPFIERSLSLLGPDGTFCFICSNRFAKSEYGARLRSRIAEEYRTALYLNLEHADVFGKDIAAYPAILMIDRHRGLPTSAATVPSLAGTPLSAFRYGKTTRLATFPEWYPDGAPWATTDAEAYRFARQIAGKLPTLTESAPGTRFGIGVATGNDAVFVRPEVEPGIEPDCLLPLATGEDVRAGRRWGGTYLVNPFRPDSSGALRDLAERPGLARYLEKHRAALSSRFVARRKEWYRTIDRVSWALFKTPKILLPDIQRGGVVGLDADGSLYPHHNLYWIVSDGWPLPLLAAILKSGFVTRQIRWASSEMRGGSIRYQAKNLGLLRIPPRTAVSAGEECALVAASARNDTETLDRLVDAIVDRCLGGQTTLYRQPPRQLLLVMEKSPHYRGTHRGTRNATVPGKI
ncbi:MAG: Eco57I restriction-modification methylase domain-containing protein [Kiritimatiellae bacterium]|nr:Eco57I restriction-modification methylase domain-containing protein [Kiritimatiellia bacterium]